MSVDRPSNRIPGVPLALASAILFGAAAPLSKALLVSIDPQMLAGLLYLGAGLGLAGVHLARRALGHSASEAPLKQHDIPWLTAVIFFGGILGPLLMMLGLSRTSAASGSLLLNLESLATMAICCSWSSPILQEFATRRDLAGDMRDDRSRQCRRRAQAPVDLRPQPM